MRLLKRSSNDCTCIGAGIFLSFPDFCWTASTSADGVRVESFSLSSSLDTISCWNCWTAATTRTRSDDDESFSLSSSLDSTILVGLVDAVQHDRQNYVY